MAYDSSSLIGDSICEDYYDIENNLMNPESPVGYFLYKVIGKSFDDLYKLINQFRIDLSILDCDVGGNHIISDVPETLEEGVSYYISLYTSDEKDIFKKYTGDDEADSISFSDDCVLLLDGGLFGSLSDNYVLSLESNEDDFKCTYNNLILSYSSNNYVLSVKNSLDTFYNRSFGFVRPRISYVENGVVFHRLMTDDEFKIYLYLRNHRLMTRKDIIVAFSNAFNTENETIQLTTTNLDNASMVDHKQYDNPPFSNDTLMRYNDTDNDMVTDKINDSDNAFIVSDKITESSIILIKVPGEWDKNFLSLLEQYSSIKGNVLLQGG